MNNKDLFFRKVEQILFNIYGLNHDTKFINQLAKKLIDIAKSIDKEEKLYKKIPIWSEKDIGIITYGNTIEKEPEIPLKILKNFLDKHLSEYISFVHILPFMPYSSDDGYAVEDFYVVNPKFGNWKNIKDISSDYKLMADLVINHASSKSKWFQNFINQSGKGKDFFCTINEDFDISKVIRPRTSNLIRKTKTKNSYKNVWCTFSHDQIDFDFRNPKVLVEFLKIIKKYLNCGVQILRLDAVAFLWKKSGTTCVSNKESHEIIKLLRLLATKISNNTVIVTETNLPKKENLTYFGNSDEAHWIYNFSMPPLIVFSFLSGDCSSLRKWSMSMPPALKGTAYLNFVASHDGIGIRPAEELLSQSEIKKMIKALKDFGGLTSLRNLPSGEKSVYEINISLIDAFMGTMEGKDEFSVERMTAAHAIMLSYEGVPIFYIHSLFGTKNDLKSVKRTKMNRAINRKQYSFDDLDKTISDEKSYSYKILTNLKYLISIRRRQKAFSPNATQFTLFLNNHIFGLWRQSIDKKQSIFCLTNVTNKSQNLHMKKVNLITDEKWTDLLTKKPIKNDKNIVFKPYQTYWLTNK